MRGLGSGPDPIVGRGGPTVTDTPFYGAERLPDIADPAAVRAVPGTVRRPDALLDEVDPIVVDGVSVTDQLRPLYRLMGGA